MKSFKLILLASVIALSSQAFAELVRIPGEAHISAYLKNGLVIKMYEQSSSDEYTFEDKSLVYAGSNTVITFEGTTGRRVTLLQGNIFTLTNIKVVQKNGFKAINADLTTDNKKMAKFSPTIYITPSDKIKTFEELRKETNYILDFYTDKEIDDLVF